jgi:hypothetical protein
VLFVSDVENGHNDVDDQKDGEKGEQHEEDWDPVSCFVFSQEKIRVIGFGL